MKQGLRTCFISQMFVIPHTHTHTWYRKAWWCFIVSISYVEESLLLRGSCLLVSSPAPARGMSMLLRLRWRLPSKVGEDEPCPLFTMMPGERRSWSCRGDSGRLVTLHIPKLTSSIDFIYYSYGANQSAGLVCSFFLGSVLSLTWTLTMLPLRLLFWLSLTVWLLLHRASNPRIPPTQSPMRQTYRGHASETILWLHYKIMVPVYLKYW